MDKVLSAYLYIYRRLQEPSSHASIAALLALAGLSLDSGIVKDVLTAINIGFGAAGFFIAESKPLTRI